MKKILIPGLALAFFIVGCGQDQGQQTNKSVSEQTGRALDDTKQMIQQAEQKATQLKETMTSQANEIAAKGNEMLDKARSDAVAIKDDTTAIIEDLVANARAALDKGRLNEAISAAQTILTNYDANSQKAKDVITAATEKLKTILAEKIKEVLDGAAALKDEEDFGESTTEKEAEQLKSTATEQIERIKSDLNDKLKNLGQ